MTAKLTHLDNPRLLEPPWKEGMRMGAVIFFAVLAGVCLILLILGLVNHSRNSHDTDAAHYQAPPRKTLTQEERDGYYLQQFGMTEADYMASVDMYANWEE